MTIADCLGSDQASGTELLMVAQKLFFVLRAICPIIVPTVLTCKQVDLL